MQRLLLIFVAATLPLTACSSTKNTAVPSVTPPHPAKTDATVEIASTTASVDQATTTSTIAAPSQTTPTTTIAAPAATGAVSQDDLVRFIAATETVLKGTANEGVVYQSPEIYIAIGQAACARFTAGDTFQQVANDLLTQLASANATDDKRLVGAILGAATQTICPENQGVI